MGLDGGDVASETDAPQTEQVIDWLNNTIKLGEMCKTDKRGIVLFTHHQYFSAWGTAYLGTAKQLATIVPKDCTVLWIWGHEHRFEVYDAADNVAGTGNGFNAYGRTIGNGGFPGRWYIYYGMCC